jgi:hypothetical protein
MEKLLELLNDGGRASPPTILDNRCVRSTISKKAFFTAERA